MLFPYFEKKLIWVQLSQPKRSKIGSAYRYLSSLVLQNMHTLGTVLLTTESFIKLWENHFV